MKCYNCGHELTDGSTFCENCGTILSLGNNESGAEMTDVYSSSSPDKINDDFMSYLEDSNLNENAQADAEPSAKEEIDLYDGEVLDAETEEILEAVFEDYSEENQDSREEASMQDTEEAAEYEAEADTEFDAELPQDENEVQDEYTAEETENLENEQTEDGGELSEMYVSKPKSRKESVIIAVLLIAILAVSATGIASKKGLIKLPSIPAIVQKTTQSQETTTKPSEKTTQEKETKEEKTTEETTEKATTEKNTTEKVTEPTEAETTKTQAVTKEPNTTKVQSTTKAPTKPSTTKPAVTKPYATKPSTTKPVVTKPSTTKPTPTKPITTKPNTTKPNTTTDRYGITDAKVQKPKTYLSKTSTVYVKYEGVILRNQPKKDSERVLYLSLGADVKVLAKENGMYYVYSNRYGVYGWVSTDYTSAQRPVSSTVTVVPNLVAPEKKFEKAQVKYVNAAQGLRLRKGPGANYDIIKNIPNGYPVKVIGYSEKNPTWVYVNEVTYGITGWVSSAYIK